MLGLPVLAAYMWQPLHYCAQNCTYLWCPCSCRNGFGCDWNQQYNYTEEQVGLLLRRAVHINQRPPSAYPHSPWSETLPNIYCLPLHLLQELFMDDMESDCFQFPIWYALTHAKPSIQEWNMHDSDSCLECYRDPCMDEARPGHDDSLSKHDGPYIKAKKYSLQSGSSKWWG